MLKLSDLTKKINVSAELSADPLISKVSSLSEAKKGSISFLGNLKYANQVEACEADAIFVPKDFKGNAKSILLPVDNPSRAFSLSIEALGLVRKRSALGVHPTAVVDPSAKLGKDITIGAHAVISSGVTIGDGTCINANCFIGEDVTVGLNCLIYPSVVIYDGCKIGDRVVIHSNTTIGSDGFGFEMEGSHDKIPQVGIVEIGNDVEIGASVTIDRARFDATKIGNHTKIDNLVQIGHNVQIGQGCFIVSQVGIAGSTKLGNGVILAGQVGVVGHITIGDGSIVAAKAGVGHDLPPNSRTAGFYGINHKEFLRQVVCLNQLPELMKKVKKFLK